MPRRSTRKRNVIVYNSDNEVVPEDNSSSDDEYDNKDDEASCSNEEKMEDDIDEYGNIKGLIDYEFQDRQATRKKREEKYCMENESGSSDMSSDEDEDYLEEDDFTDDEEEDENTVGLFFNTLFGGKKSNASVDIKKKIDKSNMPPEIKQRLKAKLETVSLNEKNVEWFNSFLKIPFGCFSKPPIEIGKDDVSKYFRELVQTLDKAVHGLSPVKEEIINYVAQTVTCAKPSPRILALQGSAGVGKCLDPQTPVLLYNGQIKLAKEIQVGDQLMGDDSTPRNVLSIASGQDEMFKITPVIGESYIVNKPHILSLKMSYSIRDSSVQEVMDLPLTRYMEMSNYNRAYLNSYNACLNFSKKSHVLDPYIMGYLLSYRKEHIVDIDVVSYFKKHLLLHDLQLNLDGQVTTPSLSLRTGENNHIHEEINKYLFQRGKYIPEEYIFTDTKDRLKFLGGFIDARGRYLPNIKCFSVHILSPRLRKDLLFLARTLGFACSCMKTGEVWITGRHLNDIQSLKFTNIHNRFFNNTIKVTPMGVGPYCGFEIDGNRRFVLGDCTVTHNTKIIREGISKVLNRPMCTFSMGGIKDSSHFVGFDFTYLNSKHGAIVQSLMDSKVMDPLIFFDELDKISTGHEGEEISNLLIHLTDPVQNHDFKDKFFDEYSIDLSRVVFVVAFNDIEAINPILRDRLHVIKIPTPSLKEKLIIAKEYVFPELIKNMELKTEDVEISDKAYEYIIEKYAGGEGIRNLRRCIESILLKVNTIKLLGKTVRDINLSFAPKEDSLPIVINEGNVEMFLKDHSQTSEVKYPHFYT